MKSSSIAGTILTGLALSLAGCGDPEPKPVNAPKPEVPTSRVGPASPEGPVVPSPVPSLPATGKVEEKKDEPKLEPPK